MRIENGKLLLEVVVCWDCEGAAKVTRNILCPNWGKPVTQYPRRLCPDCKSRNRHDHQTIGTAIVPCSTCDGSGYRQETRYDPMPHDLWISFLFRVYRSQRKMTVSEQLLGVSVYSCTDYGRHHHLIDEDLIKKVRSDEGYYQACKVTKEDCTLADHIGIFTGDQGYSVVPVFQEGTEQCATNL